MAKEKLIEKEQIHNQNITKRDTVNLRNLDVSELVKLYDVKNLVLADNYDKTRIDNIRMISKDQIDNDDACKLIEDGIWTKSFCCIKYGGLRAYVSPAYIKKALEKTNQFQQVTKQDVLAGQIHCLETLYGMAKYTEDSQQVDNKQKNLLDQFANTYPEVTKKMLMDLVNNALNTEDTGFISSIFESPNKNDVTNPTIRSALRQLVEDSPELGDKINKFREDKKYNIQPFNSNQLDKTGLVVEENKELIKSAKSKLSQHDNVMYNEAKDEFNYHDFSESIKQSDPKNMSIKSNLFNTNTNIHISISHTDNRIDHHISEEVNMGGESGEEN